MFYKNAYMFDTSHVGQRQQQTKINNWHDIFSCISITFLSTIGIAGDI